MAVPNIEPSEVRDRTVVDGLIVAAVIVAIAGVLVIGRTTMSGDRADAAEPSAVTTTSEPAAARTRLDADPVLGPSGVTAALSVTIVRDERDLVGAMVTVAGAPCTVGLSIAAGASRTVDCPLPHGSDVGAPASVTVRVTDQRGTDEALVVPLTVSAPS